MKEITLKDIREAKGYTQKEFAYILGRSYKRYNELENGYKVDKDYLESFTRMAGFVPMKRGK